MKSVVYQIPVNAAGKLAIVARPRGGDWLEDEVRAFRDVGITVIVSMLAREEIVELGLEEEESCCESNSIAFFNIPIVDRCVPREVQSFM